MLIYVNKLILIPFNDVLCQYNSYIYIIEAIKRRVKSKL